MSDLDSKVKTATKWSAITEIAAKLAAPVSGMIMARILTPEAYGAMAAISIVISFTELFSDVGFKRYIIQHEFKDQQDKINSTNVAFWTNLLLSVLFWFFIIVFRNKLAILVGSPDLGLGIAVACAGIPIAAFSSIQTALYQRDFDFKTLFYARIVSIATPFLITIPLALYTRNYWALVLGGLFSNSATALILGIKSKWTPKIYYSFPLLREMFSFSMWLMFDSILVWATSYIDVFLIGRGLDEYYLGLYRASINLVGQILAIVTSVVIPVLLPTLSRLQNDIPSLKKMLLKIQKYASFLVMPLGFGFLIFHKLITDVALGPQWSEAAFFIGIWGFTSSIMIIFSNFCSSVYPAIGKPKYAIYVQLLHLLFVVPTTMISINYGFKVLCYSRTIIRIQMIAVNFIMIYATIKLSPWKMIKNVIPEIISSILMSVFAFILLQISSAIGWGLIFILLSSILYLLVLYFCFPSERILLLGLLSVIGNKIGIIKKVNQI